MYEIRPVSSAVVFAPVQPAGLGYAEGCSGEMTRGGFMLGAFVGGFLGAMIGGIVGATRAYSQGFNWFQDTEKVWSQQMTDSVYGLGIGAAIGAVYFGAVSPVMAKQRCDANKAAAAAANT